MKTVLNHTPLSFLFTTLLAITLAACENVVIPDDEEETTAEVVSGKTYKVKVITRAAGGEILYPIKVIAVDTKGNQLAMQTLNESTDNLTLRLPAGACHITAISGNTDFTDGYAQIPMLIGNADITVSASGQTVNIILTYAVTQAYVTLRGVPADITAATVSFSPMASSVDTDGNITGSTTVTLPCTKKSEGVYETDNRYMLPATTQNTVLTIALTRPKGVETYGVTYSEALRPSVPYHFTGDFYDTAAGKLDITGNFTGGVWDDIVTGDFTFGPGCDNAFNGTATYETAQVSTLPAEGSIWNQHIVAYLAGNDALLISRQQWDNITSANYAADPTAAAQIAAAYAEDGMTGWHVPSLDEARLLKDKWGNEANGTFGTMLINAGYPPLYRTNPNKTTEKVRYLCGGGYATFSLADNTVIAQAGSANTKYYLRLVKRIRFEVVQQP